MRQERTADLCVIGAGSAGLSVAAGAAQLGADVVLIERGAMGGDCLNTGCVPSKSLIAAAAATHAARTAERFGVRVGEPRVDFAAVSRHVRGVIDSIAPHDSAERFERLGVTVLREHARFEPVWSDEAGVLAQNRNAQTLEPLDAIMGRDAVDDPSHVPAHRREVDLRLAGMDPEAVCGPYCMCSRRSGDQALGRYAARVQAITTHGTALDQHHVGAQLRGARGYAQPGGAGPNDAEIRRPLLARRVPWATPRTVGTVSSRRSSQLNLAALTSA